MSKLTYKEGDLVEMKLYNTFKDRADGNFKWVPFILSKNNIMDVDFMKEEFRPKNNNVTIIK